MLRFLPASLLLVVTMAFGGVTHYYDEAGQRHLSTTEDGTGFVVLSFRWGYDPGALPGWMGDGGYRRGALVFAAPAPDENSERGPFFKAVSSESKLVIDFLQDKPDQPDPGIRGEYRKLSGEKRLQLAKKEFQAAEERLALAWQGTIRDGRHDDKALVSDWKTKWPVLRQRWMSLSYKPPGIAPEQDADFWIRLAQATMFGYSFNSQRVDVKNTGGWAGDYDDGFGGRITIRERKEGALRVTLNCTRGLDGNELNGTDVAGDVPGSALKKKGELRSTEAVFDLQGDENNRKQLRVKLERRGGGLWVETTYLQPTERRGWLDGLYRWMPPPELE